MRQPGSIEPEGFVVSASIDDQCVPFPAADGMTVISRHEIFGMGFHIHIDGAVGVRSALVHDEDAMEFGQVHKLDSIGCQKLPWSAGWFTTRVWFELVAAAIEIQLLCPWLEWNLAHQRPFRILCRCRRIQVIRIDETFSGAAERQPHSDLAGIRPKTHSSVWHAGSGACRQIRKSFTNLAA